MSSQKSQYFYQASHGLLKFDMAGDKLRDLESNKITCDDGSVCKNIFQFHQLPSQKICFVSFLISASRGH